jgi:hypothetical protein
MESPLLRLLISSRSVNKHGHHRQFLFLIGWFLKNLLWNRFAKLPTKFSFIGQTVSVEKNIKKSSIQKQESHVAAMFVNGSGRDEQFL